MVTRRSFGSRLYRLPEIGIPSFPVERCCRFQLYGSGNVTEDRRQPRPPFTSKLRKLPVIHRETSGESLIPAPEGRDNQHARTAMKIRRTQP